ncbi:MAG: nicotinate-nucleotide diphosphorylase (carboxylating) [Chloroflexi bacterium]|nr:nicotinate-nucleotide diphosphorylase (carboxylating) [Chloroflexota bacterium]
MNIDLPELDSILDLAIREDLSMGDITTQSLSLGSKKINAKIISKSKGVLSGNIVAKKVFEKLDPSIEYIQKITDGSLIDKQSILAEIIGDESSILSGERIALNFLQRMSGVATLTKTYVEKVTNISITDTRKTIPGWRSLDKYAVRCGGGFNHRRNLGDGILIKDNHISAAIDQGLSINEIVSRARINAPHTIKIEVEVDNLDLLDEVIETDADIIMLDNFTNEQIIQGIKKINKSKLVEVSGNIDFERLEELNKINGIDIVSVGKLTHSAKALDISLDF